MSKKNNNEGTKQWHPSMTPSKHPPQDTVEVPAFDPEAFINEVNRSSATALENETTNILITNVKELTEKALKQEGDSFGFGAGENPNAEFHTEAPERTIDERNAVNKLYQQGYQFLQQLPPDAFEITAELGILFNSGWQESIILNYIDSTTGTLKKSITIQHIKHDEFQLTIEEGADRKKNTVKALDPYSQEDLKKEYQFDFDFGFGGTNAQVPRMKIAPPQESNSQKIVLSQGDNPRFDEPKLRFQDPRDYFAEDTKVSCAEATKAETSQQQQEPELALDFPEPLVAPELLEHLNQGNNNFIIANDIFDKGERELVNKYSGELPMDYDSPEEEEKARIQLGTYRRTFTPTNNRAEVVLTRNINKVECHGITSNNQPFSVVVFVQKISSKTLAPDFTITTIIDDQEKSINYENIEPQETTFPQLGIRIRTSYNVEGKGFIQSAAPRFELEPLNPSHNLNLKLETK